MPKFIGRADELKKIRRLNNGTSPKLVVIRGRRHIGKSRLAQEAAEGRRFISFTGLAPLKSISAQDQRDNFASQFAVNFNLPPLRFADWSDAFNHLTLQLTQEPTVILFDEISWMASKDNTFVPKLKIWWDQHLQSFPNLLLILCGSISTWIEENIIKSAAFSERISLPMTLGPLSIPESYQFLQQIGFKGSTHEFYELLSMIGGIPWYLEKIIPGLSTDENMKQLYLSKNGALQGEYDHVFSNIFQDKGKQYQLIVEQLAKGNRTQAELRETLGYAHSGTFSDYLKDLIICGFISEHDQWSIKTGQPAKQKIYRLQDNYLRFYLKFMKPNLNKIRKDSFADFSLSRMPGWETMMGLQLESLLLQNRDLLLKALDINPMDIVNDNPYLQTPTTRRKGCQIDYLVQTRSRNLFVCEFKFRNKDIGSEIITSMRDKINRLAAPKGFGVAPALFHLGDLTHQVHENNYFYRTVNIADFLEPSNLS